MNFIEFVSQPWHWSVSGAVIVFVMFLLLWFGGNFGASSNLRTLCAIGGAGKQVDFFKFNWKGQMWNLVFIGSAIIGGYLATTVFASPEPVQIAQETQEYLSTLGVSTPQTIEEGNGYLPQEIFAVKNLLSGRNLVIILVGGFLVGFGARYAGGCTSGHAISGLSNLQLPSLIAVIGFFIGGLLMTWLIIPFLFTI
ncbi:YeeE/YedE family protein [Portibacter lacus]|uniref:YeeE/YedE family protein n=1 Tax=Portibacter lacus TaxID=1099794 RepID=A0AA37STC2_9BACT|nr:YeeE/YedE thiosulfate transporter family protein [Portibacter lacus]GLR17675.1 hypothetical protein GCM10007940_22900 [Portibacter lacus]